jgi:hypothetical protein
MAKAKTMTYDDLYTSIESVCEDYGDWIDMDCKDEIVEKVWEMWEFSLCDMTKDMAYTFSNMIEFMVIKQIEINLKDSEVVC